jgi:hypothetical protein
VLTRAAPDLCQAHHEKAVMYFQRALKLNRKFLFAW